MLFKLIFFFSKFQLLRRSLSLWPPRQLHFQGDIYYIRAEFLLQLHVPDISLRCVEH